MIKIMFSDKQILVFEPDETLPRTLAPCMFVFNWSPEKIHDILDVLQVSEIDTVLIQSNTKLFLEQLSTQLKTIQAGGGIVINHRKEVLFIYRRGKWDFPKGKQDPGESMEACALREVREETGIENLYLEGFIDLSYHIYFEEELIFKTTWWYHMSSSDTYVSPQLEEGITKVKWIHRNNIGFQLNKTYQSIRDLCAYYFGISQQNALHP